MNAHEIDLEDIGVEKDDGESWGELAERLRNRDDDRWHYCVCGARYPARGPALQCCSDRFAEIVTDGGTDRLFAALREEIREAREQYLDEASVYDTEDCPNCGEEMEMGAVGGGEVTFGCYHNDECSFRDDHVSGYSVTYSTGAATAASSRLNALLDLCHRLALEQRSVRTATDQERSQ